MKIFVSGLVNIETTTAVRKFPIDYYPIDYSFFGVRSNVSGVGFNITSALKALGDEARFCSYTGDDEQAQRIIGKLERISVKTDLIQKTLKETPASVVLYDPEGRRQIYCDLKDIQEQSLNPDSLIGELKNCDIAVLCNINFNRELIKRAKKEGVVTACDVHVLSDIEDAYNRDFMENADILFLSDENLPSKPELFIKQLKERYKNKIIVIGMGSKGAMLLDKSGLYALKAPRCKKIVNTVGAGDSLFSAFLHFYAKGLSRVESLLRAETFAGIKIGFDGAAQGFCSENEVEQRLENHPIKYEII
ncbi:MAG: carbohydrate kinase family protein [Ruminococcus sp.]|nr:carbohydrate kinase family protein [Ruminococcus sp.]